MPANRPSGQAAEASSAPALTVAAVARRLGVAPATLRTWARRYGLGPSAHTAGAHRRYSAADVSRLLVMRRLTLEGVAPSEAARVALEAEVVEEPGGSLATVTALPSQETSVPVPTEFGRAGGGNVVALPDAGPAARGLARAALALDSRECTRILLAAIEVEGVSGMWDRLAVPVLGALGKRWESTGSGVESEHLLSECVQAVLNSHTLGQRVRPGSGAVLTGAEEEQHVLPIYAVAAALADQGIHSRVLGGRLPAEALAAAVRRSGPAAVLLYAHSSRPDADQLRLLPRIRPAPRLLLGGPGWDGVDLPDGVNAVRVGSLTDAVQEIQGAVAG